MNLYDTDLNRLVKQLGFDEFFQGQVTIEGADPLIKCRHKLGKAISCAIALESIGAASMMKYRNNQDNDISFNMKDALHFLHPTHFIWQNGYKVEVGAEYVPVNGTYQCKDGKWIHLCAGPPYLKLLNKYLNFFDCGNNKKSIAREIKKWDSLKLEDALSNAGLPASIARTKDEWHAHPQGKVLASQPLVQVEKVGDSPALDLEPSEAPLSGLRVLDFTHVLAGPRSAKALAEQGADVLHVRSPEQLDPLASNLSVNHGKHSAYLNLNQEQDLNKMHELVTEADVFINSWRPGVAERYGLGVEDVIKRSKKGIIYVTVNAYGHGGPWDNRAGFDFNGQMVSGFAISEGSADEPKLSPVFYLNDLLTAYFAACGTLAALLRRAESGGSYHVQVSLARTSMWVESLGLIDDSELAAKADLPNTDTFPPKLATCQSDFGEIKYLKNIVEFSKLKKPEIRPPVFFGKDKAQWKD